MVLEVLTPDQSIYKGEADAVQLPGSDGLFEILQNHAPLVGALGKGQMRIRNGANVRYFELEGGVVEVLNNKVSVLAEKATAKD